MKLIPIELTFDCTGCGGRRFRVEAERHGHCLVICKDCGRNVGRWRDLHANGRIVAPGGVDGVVSGIIGRALARRRRAGDE